MSSYRPEQPGSDPWKTAERASELFHSRGEDAGGGGGAGLSIGSRVIAGGPLPGALARDTVAPGASASGACSLRSPQAEPQACEEAVLRT